MTRLGLSLRTVCSADSFFPGAGSAEQPCCYWCGHDMGKCVQTVELGAKDTLDTQQIRAPWSFPQPPLLFVF